MNYSIVGNDFQTLQVSLEPGESVLGEQGSLFYCDYGIVFEASLQTNKTRGAFAGFGNAIKGYFSRSLNSEDGFQIRYINKSDVQKSINLSPPGVGGHVIDIDLSKVGYIKAFNGAYFAATGDIDIEMGLNKSLMNSLVTSTKMVTQKLSGNCHAFLCGRGDVVAKHVDPVGITVDSRCLIAYTDGVEMDTTMPASLISTWLNKTENAFLTRLYGSGVVYMQSSPVDTNLKGLK